MALYNLDSAHSGAGFSVRHMMITTVRGEFTDVSGTLNFDPENFAASSVDATLQTASVSTGVADRDGHLKSPDFFDVENFPVITFKSTAVNVTGENTAEVVGDLTIRDVTKSVTLNAEFLGQQKNPFTGATTVGFSAEAKINREDFGLTWNQALESGGVLVGKEIKISLEAQGVLAEVPETA